MKDRWACWLTGPAVLGRSNAWFQDLSIFSFWFLLSFSSTIILTISDFLYYVPAADADSRALAHWVRRPETKDWHTGETGETRLLGCHNGAQPNREGAFLILFFFHFFFLSVFVIFTKRILEYLPLPSLLRKPASAHHYDHYIMIPAIATLYHCI